MFIPTTQKELKQLGWSKLDIILISGDTYIDSSFNGIAIIGKLLLKHGYRIGIIAQPDIQSDKDITRLGEPRLFWGISSGTVDSMVANYTALKKRRKSDDFTPKGINNKRPDRALISYTNLIRRFYKNTSPVVIGGVEASLRRVAHYDYWSNKIRKPILFDAKADILIYGMGENAVLKLADALSKKQDFKNIKGISYISKTKKNHFLELPSFEVVLKDKLSFEKMFKIFYQNNDPLTAKGLIQQVDIRYLIQNPPGKYLTQKELDGIYNLDFERDVHPFYKKQGPIKALETIRFSVTSHRGCYGECNFCSIALHQGRTIHSRSESSILKEIELFTHDKSFKGYVSDIGGPTANMYGFECNQKLVRGSCKNKRCIYPSICKELPVSHSKQIKLLKKALKIKGVKKIFIASGIRHDLIFKDKKHGDKYLYSLTKNHVSGQLKLAPEHSEKSILDLMGKPSTKTLLQFRSLFNKYSKNEGKKQFLTYYLIAAHPGCSEKEMFQLKKFCNIELKINPEQIQIFTPLPSTYSALMYYLEKDPFSGKALFIEKEMQKKEKQKKTIIRR